GAERDRPADAAGSPLIRGGHQPATLARRAPHDDRLPPVFGVVALLDRGVEGVEVAVEDRSGRSHATSAPCVFAAGARNLARSSASSKTARRSTGASRANGMTRTIA